MSLFLEHIEKVAKAIKPIAKAKKVIVFSHYDADGIASAAIFAKMLLRLGSNFQIKILNQLTKRIASQFNFSNKLLVFLDFGSGQLDSLAHLLDENIVLIIDHHKPKNLSHLNLFHLNPHLFNAEEASSSVYTYYFAKYVDAKNVDLAYLALVGYFGDNIFLTTQEKILEKILNECIELKQIEVKKGLKIFGRFSKPLYKALAQSYECFIPGITGSEEATLQFLAEIGIPLKKKENFVRLADLSEEEEKMLASEIIKLRINEDKPEDIFGTLYLIKKAPEELKDVRELATLLNALGRKQYYDVAIKLAWLDSKVLNKAMQIYSEYKKEISNYIDFALKNVKEMENVYVIDAQDKIPHYAIGIITSILSKTSYSDKPVIGLANYDEETVKVSIRFSGNIDVIKVLKPIAESMDGEAGGHSNAAGAFIPLEKKTNFIKTINKAIGDVNGKGSQEQKMVHSSFRPSIPQ